MARDPITATELQSLRAAVNERHPEIAAMGEEITRPIVEAVFQAMKEADRPRDMASEYRQWLGLPEPKAGA